ncbi:hypothetical protein D8B26_003450 [Coccidioides posadasii str. Silveira]|uniref:Uncharacterized protein n=3 Tax=Coccidioides posadasii TaxID=199306 RepID=E9CZJ3_COCPS|nr:hypothetical protein CPC735_003760 [Coccidioides posadasii C735 delta SOWgp]EER26207.1 hypothetical protein CPC735_003760 [Coccidioides posadasii C735 delta SOWgp]EFW20096.1 conserved hypothetical protein [Coccidioides posadasii str. Silveira]KMM73336.1 hypothetical protein CPAG_09625 [Coccidioides posadasii RMSCC 3488]QVM08774.1 hypothetical protein D8B26_003450 [Coccidioides posadasii str. Silveira]|eukprot:XP_003068352.1 hypothetical protein CPC735_003760 [Coccidioides posadasii C735 delta SOWgp]
MGARKAPLDAKSLKTERTHAENQERAFIAASRRGDRTLDARFESAQRASKIHKVRTGRGLKITMDAVKNEEMYEEEDDDNHRRKLKQLESQSAQLNRELNLDHIFLRSARNGMSGYTYHAAMHLYPYQAYGNTIPSAPQGYQMQPYPSPVQGPRTAPAFYNRPDSWTRPLVHSRSMSIATPEGSQISHGANMGGMNQPMSTPWVAQRSLSTPSARSQPPTAQPIQSRGPTPISASGGQTPLYVGMPNSRQSVLKPRPQRVVRLDELGEPHNNANFERGAQFESTAQPQIRRYTAPQALPMDQMASGSESPSIPASVSMARAMFDAAPNSNFGDQSAYWSPYLPLFNGARPENRHAVVQPSATVAPYSNQITGVAPMALANQQSGEASRSSTSVPTEMTVQESRFVSQASTIHDISASASSVPHSVSPVPPGPMTAAAMVRSSLDSQPAESNGATTDSNARAILSEPRPASEGASSSSLSSGFLPAEPPSGQLSPEHELILPDALAPELLFDDSASQNSNFAESAFDDDDTAISSPHVEVCRRDSFESITGTEITRDQWQECFNNGFWKNSTFDNSAFMPVGLHED